MENPFTTLESRLINLEALLLNLQNMLASLNTIGSQSNKLLSIDEASDFLGMPKNTLYAKVQNREIAYSKLGGRLKFAMEDLIDYQKRNRRKTNAEIKAEAKQGLRAR